ncbi:hypothetical protein [Pseudomonas sp. OTU5201]|uniref:hypothetical protein n=1 Tax=Pseudomonas sp. OTU5201 TaxID=3043850 RepID=UPI00313E095E
MGVTVMISTRPLAAASIEELLACWLSQDSWTLKACSPDGRCWQLQLVAGACTESAERLFDAVMMSDWLVALDFDAPEIVA